MTDPRLTDLWFDELPDHEAEELRGQIDTDPAVAADWDRTRQLLDAVAAEPEDLPLRDSADIVAAIRQQPDTVRRRAFAPRAALVASALFALFYLTRPPAPDAPADTFVLDPVISSAAEWLVDRQEPEGHWDAGRWGGESRFNEGLTALAVLAIADSRRDTEAADRACRWLTERTLTTGALGPDDQSAAYNRALTAMALLHRGPVDDAGRLAVARLVKTSVKAQHENGGWGYGPHGRPNTALTTWQVLALVKARSLGFDGLDGSIDRASAWLDGNIDSRGRAGYEQAGHFPNGPGTLTAMAHLALKVSGDSRRNVPALGAGRGALDFTEVFFVASLDSSRRAPLREKLERAQIRKGPDRGSWRPDDPWSPAGGRVYATALAALTLQSGS